MKTLFVTLLCFLFVAFAFAQAGSSANLTVSATLLDGDVRNGLQGYAFKFEIGKQPTPPALGETYNYDLNMTVFFNRPSTKFFIDFDASTRHIDYYVKGEHSSASTIVLMDSKSTNPGVGKNGWVADGLECGLFSGTIYSEVPVSDVQIVYIIDDYTSPDNSSFCNGDEDGSWSDYDDGEEDDGVRLFLISFFSTFGILLFVFSLCLCAFACIRSCRYKCRARRCARKARKAAKAELKATTQLIPVAVSTPATTEAAVAPAPEQFTAPMYPVYPEQFVQYPQYSMLATAPQQYYSDQPQVQYVAFHPMMFPGYPTQPQQNQQ